MPTAVKFLDGSEDTIEILAIPFNGPFAGKDGDGEYFSIKTDLCLDWFPQERPLLYHHGLDSGPGTDVIGRVDAKSLRTDDDGHWVRAQLDKRSKYFKQVQKLIEADALGGSSGAMPHLVKRAKDGHLDRWPWVEESLTPSPCNPYSVVAQDAAKHYKSLELDLALPVEIAAALKHAEGGQGVDIWTDPNTGARNVKLYGTAPGEDAPGAYAEAAGTTVADSGVIPAETANGDSPEGSYEDLISDLAQAANGRFRTGGIAGLPMQGYAYPVATFPAGGAHQPGYAIFRCGGYGEPDDDGPGFYRVDFTIGEDGEPALGSATAMSKVYIPAAASAKALKASIEAIPLAIAASEAVRYTTALRAHAEAVQTRRHQDGRDLSDGSRQHIEMLSGELARAAEALKALLVPRAEPAEADPDRRLKLLEMELALLLAD